MYMRPLFDISKLSSFKSSELLPLECECCGKTFYIQAKYIKSVIKLHKLGHYKYCSKACQTEKQKTATNDICAQCSKIIIRQHCERRKSKTNRFFCSRSCAGTYNNTHKTTGTRRSKLEKWLETVLSERYSELNILYNNKEAINSELDIYFPDLKLGIELNGIYHYEPIHGKDKLESIQNNDNRKFQACLEQGIELVIIDASTFTYFKPDRAEKYFAIIKDILEQKLKPQPQLY